MNYFIGVVENRNDPLKLNRVQVRIFHMHTNDKEILPTRDLPWAMVMTPTTSSSNSGIGETSYIVEGTWIVGIFLDGDKAQQLLIIGTLSGIPSNHANGDKGFNDPNEVYPKFIDQPDVNYLARNEGADEFIDIKNSNRSLNISKANSIDTWDEPLSAYSAQYPYNQVKETEAGHIKEYDNTSGSERIHEYHVAGTFYEIDSTGNKVTRIVGNEYEIVLKDKNVYVKGACNLTIDGSVSTRIKGDWNIEVDGDKIETITGNYTQTVAKKGLATWSGSESNIVCNNGSQNIGLITHTHTDPSGIAGNESSTPNDT